MLFLQQSMHLDAPHIEAVLFIEFLNPDCVGHDFLNVLDHKEAAKEPETRLPQLDLYIQTRILNSLDRNLSS